MEKIIFDKFKLVELLVEVIKNKCDEKEKNDFLASEDFKSLTEILMMVNYTANLEKPFLVNKKMTDNFSGEIINVMKNFKVLNAFYKLLDDAKIQTDIFLYNIFHVNSQEEIYYSCKEVFFCLFLI